MSIQLERYEWHEAYGLGVCGCPVDCDALIDGHTGEPIAWSCKICGEYTDVPTDESDWPIGRPL